jgi:transketolase
MRSRKFKKKLAETKPKEATRKSSENTLEVLTAAIPEMIGGSADLTGSNNTKTKMKPITAADYADRIFIMACANTRWARR